MEENLIDIDFWKEEYQFLKEDISFLENEIRTGNLSEKDLSILNMSFEDLLTLAGVSEVLKMNTSVTSDWLSLCSKLLLMIFKKVQEIGEKNKTEFKFENDDSLINAYHFILGVYVGFASDEINNVLDLSKIYLSIKKTSKIEVNREIQQYANVLANYIIGNFSYIEELDKLIEDSVKNEAESVFWKEQFKLFNALQNDLTRDQYFNLQSELNSYLDTEWEDNIFNEKWIRVLKLPLKGLEKMLTYKNV